MNSDEKLIRKRVGQLGEIFRNPSKEMFNDLFTKDCDYITFAGQWIKGIDENFEVHRQLTGMRIFRGATLEVNIEKIRFLDAQTALVVCTGAIRFRWQKRVKKNRLSINTNIFVKEGESWKLAAFQNTRIKKPGFLMSLFMKTNRSKPAA